MKEAIKGELERLEPSSPSRLNIFNHFSSLLEYLHPIVGLVAEINPASADLSSQSISTDSPYDGCLER